MSPLASGFACVSYTVQRTLTKCQFLLAVARGQHLLSYRQVHCQIRLASDPENTLNIDNILLIFFFCF